MRSTFDNGLFGWIDDSKKIWVLYSPARFHGHEAYDGKANNFVKLVKMP